jgi:hypothetical protein
MPLLSDLADILGMSPLFNLSLDINEPVFISNKSPILNSPHSTLFNLALSEETIFPSCHLHLVFSVN